MRKILITGANGLLGQKLVELYIKNDIEIIATSIGQSRFDFKNSKLIYEELDITNQSELNKMVAKYQPSCIINTAAMTNVDACENDQEKCDLLNVKAVEYLVEICNENNIHLIHLSTDFIFDGIKELPDETEIPNPLSCYGKSKYIAEKYIQNNSNNWSIVRTVLVYGTVKDLSRTNIVLWAKSSLENNKSIKVVNDQFRTPTLAEDLAMGCYLIEEKQKNGIFNISGKDYMNIHELVIRVAKFYNLNTELIETTSSNVLNQAAQRPPKTGLNIQKAITEIGYQPHSFEEGLKILSEQLKK